MSRALNFHKDVFEYKSLICSIEAFSHLAEFRIYEEQKYWVIDIANQKYDIEKIINEFRNYAISDLGRRA